MVEDGARAVGDAGKPVTDFSGPLGWVYCRGCQRFFLQRRQKQLHCSPHCYNRSYNAKNPPLRQGSLFDERPRLSHQCEAIVERLKRGRATNAELARIALKYTSRISDCREQGHDIRVVERDRESGLVRYALFAAGQEVAL